LAKEQDTILVRRVKMGDKDAFGELVVKYKEQIYFMAYRMTNNHADADDLSQEAFIKAYESIGNFRENSSFFTWLYRITMNMTINHLKKIGRKHTFALDENISIEDNSNSPEKAAQQRQLQEEITKAISSLPLKQKAVVELALLEGLPHKEIAQILGCREKTVSWHLFQARKKLKEKLSSFV
jgi:RNA polymerase sigma-70 factor (ECF subfamily)